MIRWKIHSKLDIPRRANYNSWVVHIRTRHARPRGLRQEIEFEISLSLGDGIGSGNVENRRLPHRRLCTEHNRQNNDPLEKCFVVFHEVFSAFLLDLLFEQKKRPETTTLVSLLDVDVVRN